MEVAGIPHDASNRIFDPDAADKLAAKERAPLDTMPHGSFDSSNVHSALYDFGEMELFVRYLRDASADAIYRYDQLEAARWAALVDASSKGSYINEFIAFNYVYTELTAGSLPDAGQSLSNDLLRRFVTDP